MARSQGIQAGQVVLFVLMGIVLLWVGDQRAWYFRAREYVEEKILRVRVRHQESLEQELSRVSSKVVSLEQEKALLKDENSALRRQLEAPLPPDLSFIPAYAVALDTSEDESLMLVAAGVRDGVLEEMSVVSESILIGKVSAVTPKMSQVRLVSSPNSKIAVKTDRGSQGLVVGSPSPDTSLALLDRVLQNEQLDEGELLLTSGEDGLPPNLVVGSVVQVISEAREPFQRADIELAIDPAELKRVFIVGN